MELKYTKEVLSDAVSKSKSVFGVLRQLGLFSPGGRTHAYIKKRIKKFGIDTSHFTGRGWRQKNDSVGKIPCEVVLVYDRLKNNRKEHSELLRRAMVESGIDYVCEQCHIGPNWNNKRLVLEVDHKNGDNVDNRKENLRFLCPNCHSQTDNFRSKNIRPSGGMAYTTALKSVAEGHVGSNPTTGTNFAEWAQHGSVEVRLKPHPRQSPYINL